MKTKIVFLAMLSMVAIAIAALVGQEKPPHNAGPKQGEGEKDKPKAKEEKDKSKGGKNGRRGTITLQIPSPGQANVYEGEVFAQVKVIGNPDGEQAVVGKVISDQGAVFEERVMWETSTPTEYAAPLPAPSARPDGPYPGFRIVVNVDFADEPDGSSETTGFEGVDRSANGEEDRAQELGRASHKATTVKLEEPERPKKGTKEIKVQLGAESKGFIKVVVNTKADIEMKSKVQVRAQEITSGGLKPLPWKELAHDSGYTYQGDIEVPHGAAPGGRDFLIEAEVHFRNGKTHRPAWAPFRGLTP